LTEVKKGDKVLNLFSMVGLNIYELPIDYRALEPNCMKMEISTD